MTSTGSVESADAHSGRFVFREYFDDMGRVEQAVLPHGVTALLGWALGTLARSIGGTRYAIAAVRRVETDADSEDAKEKP